MPNAFIAPLSLGWNTRDPITAMRPGFGPIVDNFTIERGVPRVRRGWRVWARGLPAQVEGLLSWNGASELLFAASGTGIYDVTAPGTVGAPVVSGLTNARWSSIQFSASGGQFLFAFNGVDTPRTFNGTTWATWTGTGVTGGVSWAGAAHGRMFVGNATQLSFYYGAAGAIGGTFTEFPLQGVAQRGGGVVAMTTLSGDGGAGPQSLTVILTSNEEAIVYAGTDPSSATTWTLVGRWRIPRLLGAPHRCVVAYGGDALAVTAGGLLPLSALRSGADAQTVQERAGLTRRIAPSWREIADTRSALAGWAVTPLTGLGIVVVNVPWGSASAQQIVVSEGGAVTRWAGIPASVWAEGLGGRAFAGDYATPSETLLEPGALSPLFTFTRTQAAGVQVAEPSALAPAAHNTGGWGRVLLYGADTSDGGAGIRSEGLTGFQALGAPGRTKHGKLVQAILEDGDGIIRQVRAVTDWRVPQPVIDALGPDADPPSLPASGGSGGALVWGVGSWGVGVWGGAPGGVTRAWRTASSEGHAMAVHLRMTSGTGRPAWLGSNVVFEAGGPVR
jgi:hypothetical protein